MVDPSALTNPILDRRPAFAARDPAVVRRDGLFYVFHTTVDCRGDRPRTRLDLSTTADLREWDTRTLAGGEEMFCAPGNALYLNGRWVLCLQSYPIPPGGTWGDDSARLYLLESADFETWSEPRPIVAEGSRAQWAASPRQIDPFLVAHDGATYALYKASTGAGGALGLLVSEDLETWREASPERPVLAPGDTPDGAGIENPFVMRHDGAFRLFFSPTREGRGIGVARSDDLREWRDVRYLAFPDLPWAPEGPTAPYVIEADAAPGRWLLFFHGEDHRAHPHGAALGIAWSDDLAAWRTPT